MVALLILLPLAFAINYTVLQNRIEQSVRYEGKIKDRIAKNEVQKGDAEEVSELIRPLAEDVLAYQEYGGHKGLVNQIERSVFEAIASVAADRSLLGGTQPGDFLKGEDPAPQVCYLESLVIPDQVSRSSGVFEVFKPMQGALDRSTKQPSKRIEIGVAVNHLRTACGPYRATKSSRAN